MPSAGLDLRPTYRPDIDGLRAVAIISVLAFHAFPENVRGGFVGVDVFFVISGFLISTLIFEGLAEGRFSLLGFYARRVRRIFPALIAVLIFSLVVGRNVLLPTEFALLGKHAAASAAFIENFVLWHEAGYFDLATELKPLMHIWSLGIEEQFYLIFPALLLAAWRLRVTTLLIAMLFVSSLIANIVVAPSDQVAAFFSPATRFWELMAGALLARVVLSRPEIAPPPRIAGFISGTGLLLICGAALLLDQHDVNYPGAAAIVPVLGAVLVIWAGPTAFANRHILSARPAVFIGLISYPLYLWHWPLISFWTIVHGQIPSGNERLSLIGISFALAFLTYRYVEQPVRSGKFALIPAASVAALALLAVLTAALNTSIFAKRYDGRTAVVMQAWDFSGYPNPPGMYKNQDGFWTLGHNDRNKIMLLGDSHAAQYVNAFGAILGEHPSEGAPEFVFAEDTIIHNFDIKPKWADAFSADKSLSVVVISNFWALNYISEKVDYAVRCCGKGLMNTVGKRPAPLTPAQADELDQQLISTIQMFKSAGKTVYLVLDNPFGNDLAPRSLLHRSLLSGIRIEAHGLSRPAAIDRSEPVRSRIMHIAQLTGAHLIDPINSLCGPEICPALSADGKPLYKDYDHLSLDAVLHHVHYFDFLLKPDVPTEASVR